MSATKIEWADMTINPVVGCSKCSPGCDNCYAERQAARLECERLQGFPDRYTDITYRNKPAADGPRYRALGNSMAVPVMRWIFEQIEYSEVPQCQNS